MNLKRILPLIAIAVIAIINISIYWSVHLYYRAEANTEDIDKKIKILERANQIYPSNGLVFYELGKAYFDLGIQNQNKLFPVHRRQGRLRSKSDSLSPVF